MKYYKEIEIVMSKRIADTHKLTKEGNEYKDKVSIYYVVDTG